MSFFDWDKKKKQTKKKTWHPWISNPFQSEWSYSNPKPDIYDITRFYIYIYMVFYLIIYISDNLSTVYNSSEATPVHYHLMWNDSQLYHLPRIKDSRHFFLKELVIIILCVMSGCYVISWSRERGHPTWSIQFLLPPTYLSDLRWQSEGSKVL